MAATFIYKPGTYKGPVVLVPSEGPRTPPTITTPDGKTFTGRYLNTNEGRHQFVFPTELYNYSDLDLNYNGQSGVLASGATSYEGPGLDSLRARAKGSLGGGAGAFTPGMMGEFGAYPAYLGGMFPSPVLADYSPIKAAKYNFTDPFKFAETYGAFNRGEYEKNFNQAEDLAMRSLESELKSLTEFIPAMSALKRQETSLDNQFNQAQRTQQINTALPGFVSGVNEDLAGQRGRAQAYAEGRIPDATQDRAFELGIRSSAADRAAAGGFGSASSVARKASDLMSAEQRVKLSQYGDQLLTSNVGEREKFANFQLAPLEYSNAGNQVTVNPSISPSQLINAGTGQLNAFSGVPTSQAFSSQIQQQQYQTGLKQQTNQFNAANQLQLSEFNAAQQNNFAMSLFGYQAGFANSVAGAAQTDVNTQFGLQQQNLYNSLLQNYMGQAQNAGMLNSLFSGGAALLGSGGLSNLTNYGSGLKASAGGNVGPFADPGKYAGAMKGSGIGGGLGDIFGGVGDALGGIGGALGF